MRQSSQRRILRLYLLRRDIIQNRQELTLHARIRAQRRQIAQRQIHGIVQPEISIVGRLKRLIKLRNSQVLAVDRERVDAEQAVELRRMRAHQLRVLIAQLKRLAKMSQRLAAIARSYAAPDLILQKHQMQLVRNENRAAEHAQTSTRLSQGLLFQLQALQVEQGFFGKLLRLVKACRLHRVYDGEQIDQYAQVVLVHPVEVFERVRANDVLVFGVCPRRQ